ncbi:hypothetical protein VTL71DRAFT_14279 [Oculimacula yallundae]|uniref:Cytochrome P450 n=1 Tax=Oculimacula yallundae TaxID=86028 RepID=A0ABR4CI02_9HELO
MQASTLCLLFSFVCFAAYFLFRIPTIRRNGAALRRPPNTLPIVGNGILFLQARHKMLSWFAKCERQFGFETFQISVPSLPPGVVINDPKNLEYVFKHEGVFTKGDFFKKRSWDLFGNGIINADGELWKVQRKAGLHFLNNANLKVLTDVALPAYLEETVKSLSKVKHGSIVDLEEVLHELTTQLIGRMAYGMNMHNSDPFSKAFDYASGATGDRFQNPLWQISEIFLGGKFKDSVAQIKAFGSMIVANAVQTRNRNTIEPEAGLNSISGSLINSLLDTIDDQGMVADAALNYLSAGRDTTAQALTWTFYLLMQNSTKAAAVRREVMQVAELTLPASPQERTQGFDTTVFKPNALPYVTAVFYEALRLYPPVPFELKQCEHATNLPDGTFLPKDSIIAWCPWAMNRSTLIWGEDSEEFKPERWLSDGMLIAKTASEFPVFNGGSRTCLGKNMAVSVAVQTIATLQAKFNFELTNGDERISKNSLTLPMQGGLPCYVEMREDDI